MKRMKMTTEISVGKNRTDNIIECEDDDDDDDADNKENTVLMKSVTDGCHHMEESEISKWGRVCLPVTVTSRNECSLWSILKHCVGKELSKITMPVTINEPLSFLQRISECIEYYHLLHLANETDNPIERLEYVAAFVVSSVSSNSERLGKPFNPLLGETYEFFKKDDNLKLVCEQVSHHPPISAFHAESLHFVLYGSIQPHIKFWGKSVVINTDGMVTLKLLRYNEVYIWNSIDCKVHNIIVGKTWLEQIGDVNIICKKTGLNVNLHFKPCNWFGQNAHTVEGFILDDKKNKLRMLYGRWPAYLKSSDLETYEEHIKCYGKFLPPEQHTIISKDKKSVLRFQKINNNSTYDDDDDNDYKSGKAETGEKRLHSRKDFLLDLQNSKLLWEVESRPDYAAEYYQFSLFTMALNDLKNHMKTFLPRTDSRFRPDIRLLENGKVEAAGTEKCRLEEKQREARKERERDSELWLPCWFRKETSTHHLDKDCWIFNKEYFNRDYSCCPDIF